MVWATHKRDMEMLKLLSSQEKKTVAQQYNLTLRGLDSWLHRIRERRREYQWYNNNILNFEKRRMRMKKILLSAKLPEQYNEETDKIEDYLKSVEPKEEEEF